MGYSGTFNFNPDKDIGDLSGKTILVTGGTAGLGQQTVLQLAGHNPAHIFFTGRSQSSAEQTKSLAQTRSPKVPVDFVPLDLASLASVRDGASTLLSQLSRLDILFCNAGVMAQPPGQTSDGYETQFGTNHVGHALLIQLLLPLLLATARRPDVARGSVRIVCNTSQGYQGHPVGGILFDGVKTKQSFSFLGPWQRYGQSKLANILYAKELARRYPELTCVAVHPGVIMTGIVNNLPVTTRWFVKITSAGKGIPLEMGCWSQVWCATAEGVKSGAYYEPVGVETTPGRMGADMELAGRLWDWTETELRPWMK